MRQGRRPDTSTSEPGAPKRRPRKPAGHREATGGRLLSVPATGAELALGKDATYALIAKGELVSITIGSARRILRSSIDDYIARQVKAQHPPPEETPATTPRQRARAATDDAKGQARA